MLLLVHHSPLPFQGGKEILFSYPHNKIKYFPSELSFFGLITEEGATSDTIPQELVSMVKQIEQGATIVTIPQELVSTIG